MSETSKAMMQWQIERTMMHLALTEDHYLDNSCPCNFSSGKYIGEACIPKHLLTLEGYGLESANMSDGDRGLHNLFIDIAEEARELRNNENEKICGKEIEEFDIAEWARGKRKALEGYLYSEQSPMVCQVVTAEDSAVDDLAVLFQGYQWLANRLEPCGLSEEEMRIALSWRPLRDFIAWAVGLDKPVKLCSVAMPIGEGRLAGLYQLSVGDLDMQEKSTASQKAKSVPNMRQVSTPYNEVVYEVRVPVEEEKELTWKPQEVIERRGERGTQPSLFEDEPRWCFGVRKVDKNLGRFARELGIIQNKAKKLRKQLEIPIDVCRGQAEMFQPDLSYGASNLLDFITGMGGGIETTTIPTEASDLNYKILVEHNKVYKADEKAIRSLIRRVESTWASYGVHQTVRDYIEKYYYETKDIPDSIIARKAATALHFLDYLEEEKRASSQPRLFQPTNGVLDPYGSRCRNSETGQWTSSEECGFEPTGITTTAMGMDGLTQYEFEFKVVSLDKLIVSHDPFTFEKHSDYPQELQPRLRERAATKAQVEKIAANLEPDALLTDFHSLDRGSPIIGDDMAVEAGNGRVMALKKAVVDYSDNYQDYVDRLRGRIRDFGLMESDVDDIAHPVLVRLRLTEVDRTAFTREANSAVTIAPSAIEKARIDAQKITIDMLQELEVGENESIETALRAPKNQAFARRFLSALPENVQAALVDARGYLNRDGVHRMAMAIFVSAFQGDAGLRLAEKGFESVNMDVKTVFNAIARSIGTLAQAENLIREGEREAGLSISDDLAQTITVYAAIKRTSELTVEKYLAQSQMLEKELTDFQVGILKVLEEHKRSAKKLGTILTAYAEGVIQSPPPAQARLLPGPEVSKEELWENAVRSLEVEIEPRSMMVDRLAEAFEGVYNKVGEAKAEMKQPKETKPSFVSRYLDIFGKDVIVRGNIIYLYGRAYQKRDIILRYLESKYGKEYEFHPDFFAGENRIEFYRRGEAEMKQSNLERYDNKEGEVSDVALLLADSDIWFRGNYLGSIKNKELQVEIRDALKELKNTVAHRRRIILGYRLTNLDSMAKEGVISKSERKAASKMLNRAEEILSRPKTWSPATAREGEVSDIASNIGSGVVTGIGLGLGFKGADYLVKTFNKNKVEEGKTMEGEMKQGRIKQGTILRFTKDLGGVCQINAGNKAVYLGNSQARILDGLCKDWLVTLEVTAPIEVVEGEVEEVKEMEEKRTVTSDRMSEDKMLSEIRSNWTRAVGAQRRGDIDQARYFEGYATGFMYALVWNDLLTMSQAEKAIRDGKAVYGLSEDASLSASKPYCVIEGTKGDSERTVTCYRGAEVVRQGSFPNRKLAKDAVQYWMAQLLAEEMESEVSDVPVAAAKTDPDYIDVYTNVIEKHYASPAAVHEGSIRVLKPDSDVLVYLGCPLSADWNDEQCSESQVLIKTIVPRTEEYEQELQKFEVDSIPIKYHEEEGTEARDEARELEQAIKELGG